MATSLASFLVKETKEAIYQAGLAIAAAIGLPVSSWQPGDPTRSLYYLEAELLAKLEEIVVGYIGSGFLDYAEENGWLEILAKQLFNVDVPDPTYATTDVVLTNNGGGQYDEEDLKPGNLTFKNSATGKTFHNTTDGGGLLPSGPGTTVTLTVVADEAGSDSSAGAGEIDEMVTTLLGVTCSNPTAAIGTDKWDRATIIQQCRDKLGTFSPNGPKEAYRYVARNSALTGTNVVTDARVYADSDTGDVTVYLRSGSGGVGASDVALVEAAILKWATPLCITPTVLSATPVTVDITYELWVYANVNKSEAEVKDDVEAALEAMFAARPIGGDVITAPPGKLYISMIESTIRGIYPQAFRASITVPASDPTLGEGDVASLGTVTATIHIVRDP